MRTRTRTLPALAATLLLAAPGVAHANQAYDKVANAYAVAGGHLDPCSFTQAELEAAIAGIPPTIRDAVPALRSAMEEGVAAHERGACKGVKPDEGTTGGATPGAAPTTTIPPVTTPPVTTETAPATVAPSPTTTTTTTATTAPAAASTPERDRTPLLIALIAAGALVLLGLLAWALSRARGWDPAWAARTRHAWGEAGFRTSSTWAEFTDWLRLGR